MDEYKMILRHKDTQDAFAGYDFAGIVSPRKKLDPFTHTSLGIRKRK